MARSIVRNRFKLTKTTLEAQLFEDISARVNQGDTAKVWYSSSPAKVAQSRGSEAVVNAMSLATRDAAAGREDPEAITLKALDQLWKHQLKEGAHAGAWAWLDFGLGPWEDQAATYWGAAMAAIAVGSAPGYITSTLDATRYPNSQGLPDKLKRLRGYLMKSYNDGTIGLYDEIMLLWASTKLSGLLNEDQRKTSADKILRAQREDGGWALLMMGSWRPSDESQIKSDAYATGLVVYVLRQQGLPATDVPLESGLRWLSENQHEKGHWTAPSINRSRRGQVTAFMTDAATAYAMMALASQ